MNVQITYKEISDLIAGKYNVSPVFKAVDAKTVEVSYKQVGFFRIYANESNVNYGREYNILLPALGERYVLQ